MARSGAGSQWLFSCLQLFLKLKMFNPLTHKKADERLTETQLFTDWGKGANPRHNASQPLCLGVISLPSQWIWGTGSGGRQVMSYRCREAGHSQVTGFKDAVGSAMVFDVPWREALEAFKVSPWREPKADSQVGNWGDSALGAERRQASGESRS